MFNLILLTWLKSFNRISVNGFDGDCIVTCKDILQAVDKLNAGSDGNYGLMIDHFKSAGDDLCAYISFLLSGLLTHGIVPAVWRGAQLSPYLKARM